MQAPIISMPEKIVSTNVQNTMLDARYLNLEKKTPQ
jgi:hypothetical protein